MISNVTQHNRRNPKLCHLSKGSSPKIMGSPSINSKLVLVVTDSIGDVFSTNAWSTFGDKVKGH
jgi:hypothetical protein